MAKISTGLVKTGYTPANPKQTRQGRSPNTHYGASSRNGKRKPYRGQGK